MPTHSWGDPVRFDPHTTYRACTRCDLVKVTRHEAGRHWVEFERDGLRVDSGDGKVPPCERRQAET